MTHPEIDRDLHGLLDEVVTDPRSALRRTPRRALLHWFASPDSATARPLDATTAERHLVAVYRESLAELLLKASWLALHTDGALRLSPRRKDGTVVDLRVESVRFQAARSRALDVDYSKAGSATALGLLEARCGALEANAAAALAEAAVSLAPTDFGLVRMAASLPDSEHSRAIQLDQRLAHESREAHVRKDARNDLALRMLRQGWIHLAREEYRKSTSEHPDSPEARFSTFNLACWAGDRWDALEQVAEISRLCRPYDATLREAAVVIRAWFRNLEPVQRGRLRRHTLSLAHELPEQGLLLIGAYE